MPGDGATATVPGHVFWSDSTIACSSVRSYRISQRLHDQWHKDQVVQFIHLQPVQELESVSVSTTEGWLGKALTKLASLPHEESACREPPSKNALEAAGRALNLLFERGIKPSRIARIAEGGVMIYCVLGESGSAYAEFSNEDGGMLTLQRDGENEPEYHSFSAFDEVIGMLANVP